MYYLGIDIGASSVKLATLNEDGQTLKTWREEHKGSPALILAGMLQQLESELGLAACAGWAACGSDSDVLADALEALGTKADAASLELPLLGDIPAATQGAKVLCPAADSVIEIGAQGARFLCGLTGGGMPQFAMNESCAAGTGSFFEDQMMRLGLPLSSYSSIVAKAQSVPRLSGRCAVFAKTDIIHRQQEGVPVEDILQGLCHAMVKAYKATIVRSLPVGKPVALAGGVLLNEGVVRAVREVFALEEGELIADPALISLVATGCAREAWEHAEETATHQGDHLAIGNADLLTRISQGLAALTGGEARIPDSLTHLAPLPQVALDRGLGYELLPQSAWQSAPDGQVPCTLGVDVGSTSTNLVLCDLAGHVLDAQYLRTRGNPKAAVQEGLDSLQARLAGRVRVVAAATTGSGRVMIGEHIGADIVRDEITCQARGAVEADPAVDTVFEIGGQDSKYVSLRDGRVVDFQMNKVCAAGTGSFIEEQAARLSIALPDYGALALSAPSPVDLGERCTVFVETAINAALSKGADKASVAAGLCQSVVRNYLHKVVGTKPVGTRIVLQGGVCYNPALVAAFTQFYGDRLSVNPHFAVSGAVGAALLALEHWREACGLPQAPTLEASLAMASSPACPYVSPFKGFKLDGATQARAKVDPEDVQRNLAYFARTREAYEEGYTGEIDPTKKTVGIPRALMLHKLFPMANAYFKELGFNVLLSDVSDEDTVRDCQTAAQGETCFPFKLLHGHMKQLVDAGVDYIFMPRIHTVRHVKSTVRHNYACPYMQVGAELTALELGFAEKGITLLSPQFEMDYGQNAIAEALLGIGEQLGFTRRQAAKAMLAGGFAVMKFTKVLEDYGDELLRSLKPGERAIVLVTRNYNFEDPILNSGIARALIERGCKVLTVSHLHAHSLDISMDYPSLYWPFAQHVISGAKLVRRDPRLFAVYLTNHGCGPDAMVSHLFRREMGDKPYLQIEMDEHYSAVGIVTRIEAFLNAIDHYTAPEERLIPTSTEFVDTEHVEASPSVPAAMPSVGPYGPLVADWLRTRAEKPLAHVQLLTPTPETLELGRRETTAKEYLTFANTLGLSLAAAEGRLAAGPAEQVGARSHEGDVSQSSERPQQGDAFLTELAETKPALSTPGAFTSGNVPEQARLQLLLPSSEGAEADGQYDRVVRSILDEKGHRDVAVVAPSLDKLPLAINDAPEFFLRILAGDIALAAPRDAREKIADRLHAALTQASPQEQLAALCDTARAVAAMPAGSGKKLGVVGEWPIVCGEELVGDTWAALENAGHTLVRMPFAEYLLFLWRDAAEADEHERVTNDIMPILGETGATVTPGMPDFTRRDFGLYTAGVQVTRNGHPIADDQIAYEGMASADTVSSATAAPDLHVDFSAGYACDPASISQEIAGVSADDAAQAMQALSGCGGQHCDTCGEHDGAVDSVTSASLAHIIGPDGMPQSAHEPARPALLSYPHQRTTEEWEELLGALECMVDAVHKALGARSPYEPSQQAFRERATSLLGQFRAGNGRYRYAKAAALHARCDGVIAAASMYENVDIVLRLREQELHLAPPILHLNFDGTLDTALAEKIRTYLYYL